MFTKIKRWQFLCAGLLLLPGFAWGVSQLAASIMNLDVAREQWREMSAEERQSVVERFHELKALSETERGEVQRRYEALVQVEGELLEELPEDAREKLDQLDHTSRQEILREMLQEEISGRGHWVRSKLPQELRAQLQSSSDKERRQLLRQFEAEQRLEMSLSLAELLELDETERDQLHDLNAHQLEERLHAMRRQVIERSINKRGVPDWVGDSTWTYLQDTDNKTFNRDWNRCLRRKHSKGKKGKPKQEAKRAHGHGSKHEAKHGPGHASKQEAKHNSKQASEHGTQVPGHAGSDQDPKAGGAAPSEGRHDRRHKRHESKKPHSDPRGSTNPEGLPQTRKTRTDRKKGPGKSRWRKHSGPADKLSKAHRHALRESLRPDPNWHLEFANLSREQRREQISKLIHNSVIEFLRGEGVGEEELAKLEGLHGEAFVDAAVNCLPQVSSEDK